MTKQERENERGALWTATPVGRANAMTAADIADRAGLERRSAGTKLMAMRNGDYQTLGLCEKYDGKLRQRLWWREPREPA